MFKDENLNLELFQYIIFKNSVFNNKKKNYETCKEIEMCHPYSGKKKKTSTEFVP